MDRLHEMLVAQRDLQERVMGYSFADMTLDQRIDYIKTMVMALENELQAEVLGEVSWKPWATSSFINVESYKSELIDVYHFLMNLMLVVGMTADEIYEMYTRKRALNETRQVVGYDGVSGKCPGCRRSYDDAGVRCEPGPTLRGPNHAWCNDQKAYHVVCPGCGGSQSSTTGVGCYRGAGTSDMSWCDKLKSWLSNDRNVDVPVDSEPHTG